MINTHNTNKLPDDFEICNRPHDIISIYTGLNNPSFNNRQKNTLLFVQKMYKEVIPANLYPIIQAHIDSEEHVPSVKLKIKATKIFRNTKAEPGQYEITITLASPSKSTIYATPVQPRFPYWLYVPQDFRQPTTIPFNATTKEAWIRMLESILPFISCPDIGTSSYYSHYRTDDHLNDE